MGGKHMISERRRGKKKRENTEKAQTQFVKGGVL
jgi:hypothetical protein